jgi:hypothetical protein
LNQLYKKAAQMFLHVFVSIFTASRLRHQQQIPSTLKGNVKADLGDIVIDLQQDNKIQ